MRLLHITTYLQGGAGRAITDLALAQHQRGDDVSLFASAVPEPGFENYPEYLDRLRTAGVRVILVDSTFKRDLHRLMGAMDAIRQAVFTPPDIIHAHAAVPSMIGLMIAGYRRGPRIVQTTHGWARARAPQHVTADVHAMNAVPLIAVPSAAARAQLIDAGVSPDRLRVIAYGIADVDRDDAPDQDLADVAAAWRAAGRTVLLCIGSIGARKNQEALIEAAAAPDVRIRVGLMLIGEGDLDAIRARATSLGLQAALFIAGYRQRAARHLSLADWFVLPSTREGLPLALLEAFRAGCPAIVTDIPELAGAIEPRVTGLTSASGHAADVANALRDALAIDPAERLVMATHGRRRWEDLYQLQTMVQGYDELYAAALAQTD